ncbi:SGNH/GDSL hydrolase family protein [Micromonospora sp. NPDC007230]|uniref:SGNH/GDSL hydrolase family protein n=1 Tax=Micromonospora sp. NPDC007230 TaxID=3364237 RepID=UPI0036ACD97F
MVCFGDSITDGTGSTPDADRRWPDRLAARMLAGPPEERFGLLNAGIGGNRLLLDAGNPGQGVNALARLERDVLARTGVCTVVVLEGINDIQQDPSEYDPGQLIAAYRQIALRAHDRGLRVVGGRILPFQGWHKWTPEREAVRAAVNEWIRGTDEFDGVVDFDAATRDPGQAAAAPPGVRPVRPASAQPQIVLFEGGLDDAQCSRPHAVQPGKLCARHTRELA